MMMSAVPLKISGCLLKAYKNEIPRTEPGMIYGNMVTVSSTSVT